MCPRVYMSNGQHQPSSMHTWYVLCVQWPQRPDWGLQPGALLPQRHGEPGSVYARIALQPNESRGTIKFLSNWCGVPCSVSNAHRLPRWVLLCEHEPEHANSGVPHCALLQHWQRRPGGVSRWHVLSAAGDAAGVWVM